MTRLLRELETGGYCEPSRLLVSEYLERWLADYAKPKVSAKTYERYESICRQHLIPTLGHIKLAKLQPWHIQKAYAEALEGGRQDGKTGGLSAQTVVHHHRVLRGALHQAVRWQLLYRNPADAAEPPRPLRAEMTALNEEETAQLLRAAEGTDLYMPVLLAVTTGLRRGEVLALRWSDVDLEAGTLSVRRTTEQTKAHGVGFKEPKTKKSRRSVLLPGVAIDALRHHRAAQAAARLTGGSAWQNTDLVFPTGRGVVWNPSTFSSSFYRLVEGAGVKRVRFHDLRHSHASQLLLHGVHPKVVSERLGHSTVGLTLDTYSHLLPGLQEAAVGCIDAALREALAATS